MNDKGKNRMNQVDNEEKNKINQMSEESLEMVTGGVKLLDFINQESYKFVDGGKVLFCDHGKIYDINGLRLGSVKDAGIQ